MKYMNRMGWFLASAIMLCLTSCLNEASDPNSAAGELPGNVAALADQVASMKNSLSKIEDIHKNLSEMQELQENAAQFEACVSSINEHIASVDAGMSGVDASVAAMGIQRQVASAVGTLKVQSAFLVNEDLLSDILAVESSVSSWLGDDLNGYFAMASRQSSLASVIQVIDAQLILVDAITSDVEAGLRVGDTSDLTEVSASVNSNYAEISKLHDQASALCAEVKKGYTDAIKSPTSDTKRELKALNDKVKTATSQSDITLASLISRIEACEAAIAALEAELEKIEADVEELLGMIQSISFLSDYSSDYAVAYYQMKDDRVSAPGKVYDGKRQRESVGTIDLSFMVRPASSAAVVTVQTASIFGYYAEQIQTRAVDPSNFVDFQVQSVSLANAERGIVTVKVSHDLKDDFYYKQIGAKCALSIATGKTDITSKFVELVPKDNSGVVYVEGMKINTDDFEIEEGQTRSLTVTVNPESATDKTVTWTSSDPSIVSIDHTSGVLKAERQGDVTITATTNGVDEWGDVVTASVKVKVNPAFRLNGPLYVEVGKSVELSLDFPSDMSVETKVWMSSDETKATVKDGIVTGIADSYNTNAHDYMPVTITCLINGNITLTHEIDVIVLQPRQIRFNNYADDVNSISMKVDETISLAATILPENVDHSKFRIQYQSDGGLGWVNYDTGEIKAPRTQGARYVYVDVFNKGNDNYFISSLRRTVIVDVEPYYVKTMVFAQETMTLAPGQTAVLSPVFTSDVAGKLPTYTELEWVSSNPGIVSVNSTTGEITTHEEGSAVITATTINANAVPSGQSAKSASCVIIVEELATPVRIGDYFYSDGTWSSTRDNSKTVIGIVFSNTGAAMSDPTLMADYPTATHGLVVGLTEYNSILGSFGYSSVYNWLISNGYPGPGTDAPNGYGLTKGMTAYRNANSGYAELYDRTTGPLGKHNVSLPSGVSSWYIPSFAEMKWLYENKSIVDAALGNAGGTQINGSLYWSSTLRTYNSYNDCQGSPFDMVNGGWYAYDKKSTSYPVRVVFAF